MSTACVSYVRVSQAGSAATLHHRLHLAALQRIDRTSSRRASTQSSRKGRYAATTDASPSLSEHWLKSPPPTKASLHSSPVAPVVKANNLPGAPPNTTVHAHTTGIQSIPTSPRILSSKGLASTRPLPLETPASPTPERDGSITAKSRLQYWFRVGKAYLTFYKAGLWNVWKNSKEYRQLRRRYVSSSRILHALHQGLEPDICRREFQFYHRAGHDLKKLAPFGLILAVFGEFTPIAILTFPSAVVPYTCRIPQQSENDLRTVLLRIDQVDKLFAATHQPHFHSALAYVHKLDPFGLCFRNTLGIRSLLWRIWSGPKLRQRMENIICDALLIQREGGAASLEPEELLKICIELRNVNVTKSLANNFGANWQSILSDGTQLQHIRQQMQCFLDSLVKAFYEKHNIDHGFDPSAVFIKAVLDAAGKASHTPYIPPTLFSGSLGRRSQQSAAE